MLRRSLQQVAMCAAGPVAPPPHRRKRDPFADRKSPFEHFAPKNLFLSTVHAVAFTAAPILAAATPEPPADEDDDEEVVVVDWDKVREEMRDFRSKALKMFLRVLGGTSLKRALEGLAIRCCSVKTASRLLKDPAKSALRKHARYGSRAVAAARLVRTAAYANALSYASNLVLEEALLAAHHAMLAIVATRRRSRARTAAARSSSTPSDSTASESASSAPDAASPSSSSSENLPGGASFRHQTRRVLLGHLSAYACSTIGIALGTLLKPGWGTVLGGAFGDLGGILLF